MPANLASAEGRGRARHASPAAASEVIRPRPTPRPRPGWSGPDVVLRAWKTERIPPPQAGTGGGMDGLIPPRAAPHPDASP